MYNRNVFALQMKFQSIENRYIFWLVDMTTVTTNKEVIWLGYFSIHSKGTNFSSFAEFNDVKKSDFTENNH